jgi:ABC-type antimicrobial peptide transport system ATPase subunit
MVVVIQELASAGEAGDTPVMMAGGAVVESGQPRNVLARP